MVPGAHTAAHASWKSIVIGSQSFNSEAAVHRLYERREVQQQRATLQTASSIVAERVAGPIFAAQTKRGPPPNSGLHAHGSTVYRVEAGDLERQRTGATSDEAVAASERKLADRLDGMQTKSQAAHEEGHQTTFQTGARPLDANETERVFQRALELEAESLDQPHMFSSDQLERIADEIHMDVSFVRRALGEVRMSPGERSRLDRLILPDNIIEAETLEGMTHNEAAAFVTRFMREYEGLIEETMLEDGAEWTVDRRVGATLRTTLNSGGNRVSRIAGTDISHRLYSISADEHVVAMQSKGERPLAAAKAGLALAGVLLLTGAVNAIGLELVPFIQTMVSVTVASAAVAAGSIWGARRWAANIGRALRGSLTTLAARAKAAAERPARRLPRWTRRSKRKKSTD